MQFSVQIAGDDLLMARFYADDERALLSHIQAHAEQLRCTNIWLEAIPGFDTLTVQIDPVTSSIEHAQKRLELALSKSVARKCVMRIEIDMPVCYGGEFGPDLEMLATQLDMEEDEIIALHLGQVYQVDLMGFTPGFAYCGVLPEKLTVPRLETPHAYLSAGSVGIAGRQTGLYSLAGPGGWQIIGRTPLQLFDSSNEEPFLLSVDTQIRFRRISEVDFDNFTASRKT